MRGVPLQIHLYASRYRNICDPGASDGQMTFSRALSNCELVLGNFVANGTLSHDRPGNEAETARVGERASTRRHANAHLRDKG